MRRGHEVVTAKDMLESSDPEVREVGKIILSGVNILDYFNFSEPDTVEITQNFKPITAIEAAILRSNSQEPWRDFIK